MYGSKFNVSSELLRDHGVPLHNFEALQRRNLDDFVFVTAADVHYMHVAMDAVANVQRLFPNHSIYFYDLNINDTIRNVSTKVSNICQTFSQMKCLRIGMQTIRVYFEGDIIINSEGFYFCLLKYTKYRD